MQNGTWYNAAIFSQFSRHKFEGDLKTGCKERYEFMCAVNAYVRVNI